jgi:uncharacterized low-complexity protein
MSRKSAKPIATTIGAAFVGSMMVAGSANAASNPFGLSELSGGYAQVASNNEGKCGAGKCGGNMKGAEGKCGAGKCGGSTKDAEGKCGAGKCGGSMKGAEGKCGAGKCGGSMKGAEGKCGAGKCGGSK